MNIVEEILIGVDIGGTAVKIGFINHDGDIIYKWEIPTNKANQGMYIVDDIWNAISAKLASLPGDPTILGIGVGSPGFIDKANGRVFRAVNIGWRNYALAKELGERSRVPVLVENDANLVALGENWHGSGNNVSELIAVTLGTGVGGGVIVNGEIVSGMNGNGGEIGHITVDINGYPCNCGRKGCLETIASATGMVHQAMNAIQAKPESDLVAFRKQNTGLTAKDIFALAEKGEETCTKIIDQTADALGFVLANTAAIINPTKILLGGGVSKAGDTLLQPVTKYFKKYALPRVSESCEVTIAKLGNDAGMIGAAYLVKQAVQRKVEPR